MRAPNFVGRPKGARKHGSDRCDIDRNNAGRATMDWVRARVAQFCKTGEFLCVKPHTSPPHLPPPRGHAPPGQVPEPCSKRRQAHCRRRSSHCLHRPLQPLPQGLVRPLDSPAPTAQGDSDDEGGPQRQHRNRQLAAQRSEYTARYPSTERATRRLSEGVVLACGRSGRRHQHRSSRRIPPPLAAEPDPRRGLGPGQARIRRTSQLLLPHVRGLPHSLQNRRPSPPAT